MISTNEICKSANLNNFQRKRLDEFSWGVDKGNETIVFLALNNDRVVIDLFWGEISGGCKCSAIYTAKWREPG